MWYHTPPGVQIALSKKSKTHVTGGVFPYVSMVSGTELEAAEVSRCPGLFLPARYSTYVLPARQPVASSVWCSNARVMGRNWHDPCETQKTGRVKSRVSLRPGCVRPRSRRSIDQAMRNREDPAPPLCRLSGDTYPAGSQYQPPFPCKRRGYGSSIRLRPLLSSM